MNTTTTSGLTFEIRPSSQRRTPQERAALLESPGFGNVFTDHMVTIRYTEGRGWHDARLEPYGPLPLDPATAALHYAQEIFEGLKAYRHPDGSIAAFRPEVNAARLNASARRLAMPELPEDLFLRAIETLLEHDREWVPTQEGHSLYLRPFMFATDVGLGVNNPSRSYLFLVIASPAASYFSGGIKPVTVWLSEDYTRAAPGGTGAAKFAGNYAASFLAQAQAVEQGCDQVVWLDAVEHRWVEEMGGMNLFFVFGSGENARLLTPALTGTLLPGITRDSLLKLGPELGIPAEEGRLSTDEWRAAALSGELTEVFACGTAAVITPVGHVRSTQGDFRIGDGTPGPVTMRLREELVGIQYGERPDSHGWVRRVG
ncbi:branched-chain amino acid aminotransferase [Marinitenerispora sediminis]|uniref:Branched-chain-amino-acid aminotransferase n=1 Tax=Marinitenerispora sediminis TaxID=1931232 RepID=A0A368T475_9ACTN|nr:branched-chain amino acid aminotransferase [Marinitenerispora sediminis]RCV51258.1 branched chain amino acid aminotransferase [Marinitenerispora sediminis]RCV55512.1 branched chain amino acid aminotransferase [Marinitenerispora sediminis]RCV58066.1 branched chain amino acid aminotransferase [Marinitenerispora sediminis]